MVPTWNSLKLSRTNAARMMANATNQSITTRNGFTTSRFWTPLEESGRCDLGGGGGSNSGSKVDRWGSSNVRQGFRATESSTTFLRGMSTSIVTRVGANLVGFPLLGAGR